jgi:two-component system response regulator
VEDNPQDVELILRSFRQANLLNRVEVARDGVEALDFLFGEGAHAGRVMEVPPMLILLDLKLPRIDGLEVLKRIKADQRTSTIPVVMLTSSQEPRDVRESYHLGVNSYLVKPVDFERFSKIVEELGIYWLSFNQLPNIEQ